MNSEPSINRLRYGVSSNVALHRCAILVAMEAPCTEAVPIEAQMLDSGRLEHLLFFFKHL